MKKLLLALVVLAVTLSTGNILQGQIQEPMTPCEELWEELAASLPGPTDSFDLATSCASNYGTSSYIDIMISNDGVLDGAHGAWCLDLDLNILPCTDYEAYTAGLLTPGTNAMYDALNWLLNNYSGYIGQTSAQGDPYVIGDVQAAIWIIVHGSLPAHGSGDWSAWAWGLYTWGDWTDHTGGVIHPGGIITNAQALAYDSTEYNADVARAQEIVTDAANNSVDYVPGCDEVVGVVLLPYLVDSPEVTVQPLLISIPAPCCVQEGCTPGFWKNNADKKGANAWEVYSPGDSFSSVFGRSITIFTGGNPDKTSSYIVGPTLLQALGANGGGINALARHATAALLNISSGCVNYPYAGTTELINAVQAAIDSGDEEEINTLHTELMLLNEAGCPINQKGECVGVEEEF